MTRLLVTGATGFVGRVVCRTATERGFQVRRAVRNLPAGVAGDETFSVGDIGGSTDWTAALAGVEVVIHLAARVHVMRESALDADAAFRAVNVEGTRRLAEQASRSGVRRMIYVSSIKVHGESAARPLCPGEPPAPDDAYARSKLEAERLLEPFGAGGLEIVRVRPPLVYGPGVGGNILRLLRWIDRGIPLPLGGLDNRRSLIGVDNLADLLLRCAEHPAAAGKVFLAADGQDVSTPGLIEGLARGLGRPARLFPVPHSLLRQAGRLLGWEAELARLTGSLRVDCGPLRSTLGWVAPLDVDTGLYQTGAWYREAR